MAAKKVGFIGCGNMAGAILDGIIQSKTVKAEDIIVFDLQPKAMERGKKAGAAAAENIEELCQKSDVIFLGVKPNAVAGVLKTAGAFLKDKALISIAAGISVAALGEMAGASVKILRVMPNAPAMVGAGAIALCQETTLTKEEMEFAEKMFQSIGIVEWVPEKLIDAVTGLSGSGPAYVAMFIEALADGGVKEGLPRTTAYRLAAQTVLGTAKMVVDLGIHPGELKDMVCSPGGTTIEGVYALEAGAFRALAMDAVYESARKSRNI